VAVSALRSLFTWAKKTGVIFRNPAARIKRGKREHPVWQPLTAGQLADAVAAASTPQARLCLVLAAVHAARPGAIRGLQLDDADLASGRLHLVGASRPMGELTRKVLREWLEYRQRRWPHTANPHFLLGKESALRHGPVSTAYLISLRACPPRWSGCGSTASSPRPWPPGSTRCTWPKSSASASTTRPATPSTPGN